MAVRDHIVVEAMAFHSVTTFWAGSMLGQATMIQTVQTNKGKNLFRFMARLLSKINSGLPTHDAG